MTTATPVYKITANDKDITATLQPYLMSLAVTDQRGLDNDALEVELDDAQAQIRWPRRGVQLQVWLGYTGEPLHYHGKFVVDEVAHSGPPDKITIRAKAPDLLAGFKGVKTRSWDKTTLGAIVSQIAADNKLTLAISDTLSAIQIVHIDQTNESDANFLTRVGKMYGAVAKAADGRLIFTAEGKALSVSGKPLPVFKVKRSQINEHHYIEAGRQEYNGVEAMSYNYVKAQLRKVTASASGTVVTDADAYPIGKENLYTVKGEKPNEAEAKAAAEAEWNRLKRGKTELELDIRQGIPGLRAETRIPVSGIRPYIDGDWIATEVKHSVDNTGLHTSLKCERPDDYNANDTTS